MGRCVLWTGASYGPGNTVFTICLCVETHVTGLLANTAFGNLNLRKLKILYTSLSFAKTRIHGTFFEKLVNGATELVNN